MFVDELLAFSKVIEVFLKLESITSSNVSTLHGLSNFGLDHPLQAFMWKKGAMTK